MRPRWAGFVLGALLSLTATVHAIGQSTCVSFAPSSSSLPIVDNEKATPVFISADDWPGVQQAASDFVSDIEQVTGVKPSLTNITASSHLGNLNNAVIIGTLGHSSLIDAIVNHTRLDVSSIDGQWEAFMAREVKNPLPGVSNAYVIIGADKRGSIFALYDHSEQFGVSPWYWWADVPTTRNSQIFVASEGCSHSSPTVKYRGLFLNDEQPALQNWAMEKFTNGTGAALTGSPFNHFFYTKLFELLLRLKANYLWPAQWSSAFGVDDDQNQPLADWYGIVMGTSHEEPMMRSIPVEWGLFGVGPWDYGVNKQNIYNFWVQGAERGRPYEGIWTVGMRGDEPINEEGDISLLEEIVSDQRTILSNVFNTSDVTTIPQMWCLYQEVEGYYDDGMRVPDDITLLWTDDTWGNIRRFPIPSERNRTGGAGVYYHYDLVGPPRDYKWITTFEQMSTAVARDAVRIWLVNVGDLKPYEMGIEFFMTYGWNSSIWNQNNLDSFVSLWAQREFDMSETDGDEVATIIANLTRFNSRRKPELLNSTTYSLVNYREADNVVAGWQALNASATQLANKLPSSMQPAFFQLVLHPVRASATVGTMWIYSGINNLRVSQARLSANEYAEMVSTLFEQDYDLELEYHSLLDGKDHMMDQTHIMYYYWQQPMANTMPFVSKVQSRKQALPGAMRIVPEGTMGSWPGDNQYDCTAGYNCPNPTVYLDAFVPAGNRFIDVGAGGPTPFTFTVTSNVSWAKITPSQGSVSPSSPEQRVVLSAAWDKVEGAQAALITFNASVQDQPPMSLTVTFIANHTTVPSGFTGFVEGDGGVSIEAAHAARNTSVAGISWVNLPGYGRTLSGVTPWPRGGDELNFTAGTGPSIEYDFYTFNSINGTGNVTVTAYMGPTLNGLGPDRPLAFAMAMDSGEPQVDYFVPEGPPGGYPPQWNGYDGWVADNLIYTNLSFVALPGVHTVKIWMVEPAVIFEKLVIDTGGVQPSYLGPPESIFVSS
ncbi:hypothetical protein OBBRIDRAFT_742368 [Obba rivulosa]|uniref:Gylcosyl hydrolase 115 C-terminal domain-containing protein n=1 Tax=Obba rivulosa TaxID=1052685 RepID=A0A8E2AIE1_9APHY|nr:hypothetical protein OBBRIDRAFT_742368 [Obba rivulosa]